MIFESNNRLTLSAGVASLSVATILVLLKFWALAETGSLSVAASLTDSGLDLMMSLAAMAAIIYAARPPDEDHVFGHSSAEDLAALGQAIFILFSAGLIAAAAFNRLLSPVQHSLASEGTGMLVMAISILLTLALVLWQGYVAKRTGNKVIQADRLHYLADLLPNIGAILSLWASRALGWVQIDSFVAIMAAAILGFGALKIGKGALDALMDRAADPKTVAGIAELAQDWPGVRGFHDLKTRTAGSRLFVNLHIELDGDLPLREAHDIGAGLRQRILQAYPHADVIIHKDVARNPAE
ncbi:MAG: cation diffusion facilitator family transporter [Pseudorhodobacter sp.]